MMQPADQSIRLIITLAARHKLPAVYAYRFMVTTGGLVSYGPDVLDQYRRAAGYVDRILKGRESLTAAKHDRQGARDMLQCRHAGGGVGQQDVRCECDQFLRVCARPVGIVLVPADVDLHVAAIAPA